MATTGDTVFSAAISEPLTESAPPPVLSAVYRTTDRCRAHWLRLNRRYLAELAAMGFLLVLALAVLILR